MVFSSPIFLFGFLPLALLLYYVSPKAIKNIVLLLVSLVFYAWGEVFFLSVMLLSIASNYFVGKSLGRQHAENASHTSLKTTLILGVVINIVLLIAFKYANFMVNNANIVLAALYLPLVTLSAVHLPLGISFFTFQAISYIVDVYRKETKVQNNILDLALYISLFPQLIAGPIVRYHDIATQIVSRVHSTDLFASGVQRFIIGLAKKMLIANTLGELAENIFSLAIDDNLTAPLAWVGVLAYALQIYYDFSGYSDMAIGLGRMFGFQFQENFNYPYISTSLREFWRRWHISLSTWFRDYVYIPLGGSRVSTVRVYVNLFLVFVLTGVWHGANWSFIVWGLFHGVFLALEHAGLSKVLNQLWRPLQHFYLISVVMLSWVFFRANTLTDAMAFFGILSHFDHWYISAYEFAHVGSDESIYMLVMGVIFSLPIYRFLKESLEHFCHDNVLSYAILISIPKLLFLMTILSLSLIKVASSTYNPFIYFRF